MSDVLRLIHSRMLGFNLVDDTTDKKGPNCGSLDESVGARYMRRDTIRC
jgi:hypothetical protein